MLCFERGRTKANLRRWNRHLAGEGMLHFPISLLVHPSFVVYFALTKSQVTTALFSFSAFLGNIKAAFGKNPKLKNLLLDPFFKDAITKAQSSWRNVVATAATSGVPTPCFSTALTFYDGYRCSRLPANLLQVR